jgi:hypothetical protein
MKKYPPVNKISQFLSKKKTLSTSKKFLAKNKY